jgi:hypothetical protein
VKGRFNGHFLRERERERERVREKVETAREYAEIEEEIGAISLLIFRHFLKWGQNVQILYNKNKLDCHHQYQCQYCYCDKFGSLSLSTFLLTAWVS